MAKVTSKLQVTLPRVIADRLKLFDAATIRQKLRQRGQKSERAANRGWRRDDAHTCSRLR